MTVLRPRFPQNGYRYDRGLEIEGPNTFPSTAFPITFGTEDMEGVNISELVERLGSEEDSSRKMAAFKLQSNIGDPSFADVFISDGGLTKLHKLALTATGNTLAYSLVSFSHLLEIDKGWEAVDQELVQRVRTLPSSALAMPTGRPVLIV